MECIICSQDKAQVEMLQTRTKNCFACPHCSAITYISTIAKNKRNLNLNSKI